MTSQQPGRACAWCSAAAPSDATTCPACGAALAQREDLAGLAIPGVTAVDPALRAYDAQPTRIPGASPSQGLASGAVTAAALGGPAGLAVLGGIAAVAAAEYLGARPGGTGAPGGLEAVGRPSEAALRAAARLEGPDEAGDALPAEAPAGAKPVVDDSAGNSDNSTRD